LLETKLIDVRKVRSDFPIFSGAAKPLIYLDNAATSQKPIQVIRALEDFYAHYNANIHRGVYDIAEKATEGYEAAREKVRRFISAPSASEIVFTRNTTESLNLVAQSWGRAFVNKGDRIVVTLLEHHSNIVPWQMVASERKAKLEYVAIDREAILDMADFKEKVRGAKVVAFTHVSNVAGTINPVKEMTKMAKAEGALVVVDGAQAVPHMPVDVSEIGCDFYAFSVSGDTPILVQNSKFTKLLPIEEAVEMYDNGADLSVLTLDGSGKASFEPIVGSLSHLDETYEISYEGCALPIIATGHHSVYVWRDGKIRADKVSNLRSGDYMITLNATGFTSSAKVSRETQLTYEHHGNRVTERIAITPDLMRLVGYYLAEGSVDLARDRVQLTFSAAEESYVSDSISAMENLEPAICYLRAAERIWSSAGSKNLSLLATEAGISYKTAAECSISDSNAEILGSRPAHAYVYLNRGSHAAKVVFVSKKWATFFSEFCGLGLDKHLPDFVWNVDTPLVVELLKGYLRGGASKNETYRLPVTSVSKSLIAELSWLLKLHGISNTVGFRKSKNAKWNDRYSLVIQRSSLSGLKEFGRRNHKTDAPRGELLCVDALRDVWKLAGAKYDSKLLSILRSRAKRATRKGIQQVADWIESTHTKPLSPEINSVLDTYRSLVRGDVGLTKIRHIRAAGRQAVYDISVRKTERFFGGWSPVLLHNSAHKMLGPTGVGVLFGRKGLLEEMPPFLTGGDMISEVHLSGATWNELPWKFEAGTSNIADVIAFGVALDYLSALGMANVRRHEERLTTYALSALSKAEGVSVYGPKDARQRSGVVAFNVRGVHPHDVASYLNGMRIAVRSGYHCAQPLHEWLDLPSSVRASFYIYNMEDEVDALVGALEKAGRVFAR